MSTQPRAATDGVGRSSCFHRHPAKATLPTFSGVRDRQLAHLDHTAAAPLPEPHYKQTNAPQSLSSKLCRQPTCVA